jgi:hypothetical protein
MDASLSMGRSARSDSDGVMMIEKGHVTMVASGRISSLAVIESPDETGEWHVSTLPASCEWQVVLA